MLIGRDGGAIVATVLVGHDGHRGWVYYVAVDPDRRHKGYGRAIMNAAEDWLRARGIENCNCMVRGDNTKVHAFYQSLGYYDAGAHRLRQMARRPRADAVTETRNAMTVSDRIRVKNVRVLSDNHYHAEDHHFRMAARQRRVADPDTARPSTAAMPRRCCPIIWRSAPWCWCGSFAIRPSSTVTTIS